MGSISNIRVEPCKVLWGGSDLGFTEGDIEVGLEEKKHEIEAHQEGKNKLGAIRLGKNVKNITIHLKETQAAQINAMLAIAGATATGVSEVSTITCVADVASSLNSKYFLIESANGAIKYYVWFNVATSGVDPAIAGRTGIAVAIASGATASAVASALRTALAAVTAFSGSTAAGAVVTVPETATGGVTDLSDGTAPTGFTFAVSTQGIDAVTGWGNSKDFTAIDADCKKLVLHPVALSDTDQSRDLAFWKAYLMLDSLKYSGEKEQVLSITFEIYPDFTRAAAQRLFVFGKNQ